MTTEIRTRAGRHGVPRGPLQELITLQELIMQMGSLSSRSRLTVFPLRGVHPHPRGPRARTWACLLAGALTASSAQAQTPRQKVLDYLEAHAGVATLLGQHDKENAAPADASQRVAALAGRAPALWDGDFGFGKNADARAQLIAEAKAQWAAGALVGLMYHACPPTRDEHCSWQDIGVRGRSAQLTDAQFVELTTPGTPLYEAWIGRLDTLASYLRQLDAAGVGVVLRPLHEMNQCVFWWACHKGPNGSARLYQITHDYLVKTKGLDNIVWAYSVQDFPTLGSDLGDYSPGPAEFDIATLDVYGGRFTPANYARMLDFAKGKLIAVAECRQLPTPAELASQPRWSYVTLWPDFVDQNAGSLPALYRAPRIVTLDQMPGWRR
jgi:hypothetical protein